MIIWFASQRLYELIKLMFDMKMLNKDEPQHYTDPKIFMKMPLITEVDFSNIIEPILLLDTMNRICFNMTPYRLTKTKVEVIHLD